MTRLQKRSSKRAVALAVIVLLSLVAAACGDDDGAGSDAAATSTGDEPTAMAEGSTVMPDANDDVSSLTGDFLVSGSSTVFPIVLRQAEEFGVVAPGVAIAVEGPGSGDGAKKFCAGDVPIANASRLFKDEEIAVCEAAGIEFIELRRGIDGISVVTSPENDAVECVSFNDLYALLSEESRGFESWADANALTSTWGGQEFPDVGLDVYGPGEESGTFDSFTELVIDAVAGGKTGLDTGSREFAEAIRPDYTSSPDDNVIIQGIGSSAHSLGWIGYSYAQSAADSGRVKLVAVSTDDGGDCVVPSPETIASAEFPISRFLYTYVDAEAAATDPAVAAFVDYMLSDAGLESVTAAGYIDLTPADQTLAQAIWANRTVGRQWT